MDIDAKLDADSNAKNPLEIHTPLISLHLKSQLQKKESEVSLLDADSALKRQWEAEYSHQNSLMRTGCGFGAEPRQAPLGWLLKNLREKSTSKSACIC